MEKESKDKDVEGVETGEEDDPNVVGLLPKQF